MINPPTIVQTEVQAAAVIRLTVPREEMQHVMRPAIQELMTTLAIQGVTPSGPLFSHHFRMDPAVFDFEVGIPVASPITPTGRVTESELPATTVARTTYAGPYEDLGSAWGEFGEWIAAEGHQSAPDLWECYVSGPEASADPADWHTELNQPLIGV
jgi:effector-binding domain-containing protein